MLKPALVALGLLSASTASVEAASLAAMPPDAIAAIVDVRSFPNSLGPRRQDDLRTFRDYGFTDATITGDTVELREQDGSWMFGITILVAGDDHVVLCILDRAIGGPSYDAQGPVAFAMDVEGLLVATGEDLVAPGCPSRP